MAARRSCPSRSAVTAPPACAAWPPSPTGLQHGQTPPRVVVFLDADYSDHPELLPQLVEPILQDQADLVLGSRLAGRREPGAMPPQSVFGNHLACFLMRWLFGAKYTDLGPFRAIGYQALCELEMADRNFGWTIEMQIKAVRAGLRIREIPVPYRRRVGRSKISGTVAGSVRAGGKILWTIAQLRLAAPRLTISSLAGDFGRKIDGRKRFREGPSLFIHFSAINFSAQILGGTEVGQTTAAGDCRSLSIGAAPFQAAYPDASMTERRPLPASWLVWSLLSAVSAGLYALIARVSSAV